MLAWRRCPLRAVAIFTSFYDVSHAMGFRVWGRNSIKNHSLTLLDNISPPQQVSHCSKSRHCLNVRFFLGGGGYKGENMSNYLDRISNWRPVPLKRDGRLIPNLIGTYLCRAKNGKNICNRILDCREMGVENPEVTTI